MEIAFAALTVIAFVAGWALGSWHRRATTDSLIDRLAARAESDRLDQLEAEILDLRSELADLLGP